MINIEINDKVYKVNIATTDEEKEQGLQGVDALGENEGMLFIYDEPQEVSFWMDSTPLYLDIIFIDEYGEVISVAVGQPNDQTPITEKEVKYVLEVNTNSGISAGDEVDLSELDEEDEEETETPEEEAKEEEDTVAHKMTVLNEDGSVQMELEGGERIFSRIHTKRLISLSKKAVKSKKDADYKKLGKKAFEYINKQNTQEQEYVTLKK